MSFQDPTLLPWRDVYHNIALPLELAGEDRHDRGDVDHRRRDARVRQAIELVGLADFAGSYPAELSGGMRMRVSLARAVVTDPALLLLDEPFAALDDITRQTLNEELLSLWESRHWTGIFVTHNIAEAIFLSQRVLVLTRRPGRVVADVAVPFPFPRTGRAACPGRFRPADRRGRRSSARGQPMKKRLGQLLIMALPPVALFVLLVAIWQIATGLGNVPDFMLPAPLRVCASGLAPSLGSAAGHRLDGSGGAGGIGREPGGREWWWRWRSRSRRSCDEAFIRMPFFCRPFPAWPWPRW